MELAERPDEDILEHVGSAVREKRYRVRSHAHQHMIAEGLDENHLVEALSGKLQLLERYDDDSRCLVLGHFHFTQRARSPLHVVCDVSNEEVVDVVTAYIPTRPWWINETHRG